VTRAKYLLVEEPYPGKLGNITSMVSGAAGHLSGSTGDGLKGMVSGMANQVKGAVIEKAGDAVGQLKTIAEAKAIDIANRARDTVMEKVVETGNTVESGINDRVSNAASKLQSQYPILDLFSAPQIPYIPPISSHTPPLVDPPQSATANVISQFLPPSTSIVDRNAVMMSPPLSSIPKTTAIP
jgi:hypothetical protein